MVKPVKKKAMDDISDEMEKLIQQSLMKKEKANKLISNLNDKLKDAKKSNINTSRSEVLKKSAQSKLDNPQGMADYDEAIKLIQNAFNILSELKKQHDASKKAVLSSKKMLSEEEGGELDLLVARDLNRDATKAFKSGDYENATALAEKCKKMITTLKQNFEKATDLIQKSYTKINDAKIIDADTAEPERLYHLAILKMEKKDYTNAIKYAAESIEAADNTKTGQLNDFRQQTVKIISELQKSLEEARAFGADISKTLSLLKKVKTSLENNEIQGTLDLIDVCKSSIDEAKSQHQDGLDKLNSAISFIEEAKNSGVDISKTEPMIDAAKDALKKFDYNAVEKHANAAREQVEKSGELHRKLLGLKEQAEDLLRTARSIIKESTPA